MFICLPKLISKYFSVIKTYEKSNIIKLGFCYLFLHLFCLFFLLSTEIVFEFFPSGKKSFLVSHVFASLYIFLFVLSTCWSLQQIHYANSNFVLDKYAFRTAVVSPCAENRPHKLQKYACLYLQTTNGPQVTFSPVSANTFVIVILCYLKFLCRFEKTWYQVSFYTWHFFWVFIPRKNKFL